MSSTDGAPKNDDLQATRRKIFDELTKIVDPEIGVSIMELELIDKVDINSDKVAVDLHLTSPFCPAVFGFKIAQDVRDNIYKLQGINEVKVQVRRGGVLNLVQICLTSLISPSSLFCSFCLRHHQNFSYS